MKVAKSILRSLVKEMFLAETRGQNKALDVEGYKDDIDYAFANYALNELQFFLDDDQKEYSKNKYGGLDGVVGGVIYSGGRIETERKLQELQSLKSGGRIHVSMKSFTHYEGVARDFADFVKTYDPLVGITQMKAALERGSAGKLGSYVMVVKADPDTILINTARKDGVTSSSEPELIVDGTVQVLEVKIFEPLTKNNWAEMTLEEWKSLKDLKGSVFLAAWLENHEVDPWPQLEKFLNRTVRTSGDLANLFLSSYNLIGNNMRKISAWAVNHPASSKFVEEIELQSSRSKDMSFVFNGKRIYPGRELSLKILKLKGVPALLEALEAKAKSLKSSMQKSPQSYKKSFSIEGQSPITELWDVIRVLRDLNAVGALKKAHMSSVKDFNMWIKKIVKEEMGPESIYATMEFHQDMLSGISENPWKKASTPEETLLLLSDYTKKLYNALNSREFSHFLNNLDTDSQRKVWKDLTGLLKGSVEANTALQSSL
jgi:hypothetical protein